MIRDLSKQEKMAVAQVARTSLEDLLAPEPEAA